MRASRTSASSATASSAGGAAYELGGVDNTDDNSYHFIEAWIEWTDGACGVQGAACGYDVRRTRLLAFTLSGLFSGLAGALYGIHLSVVPIETLHYFTSATVLMMTLLGGMGTFFGPFLGAFAYLLLADIITVMTVHWQLFVGALFVILILFFPRGIWGTIVHRLERRVARMEETGAAHPQPAAPKPAAAAPTEAPGTTTLLSGSSALTH